MDFGCIGALCWLLDIPKILPSEDMCVHWQSDCTTHIRFDLIFFHSSMSGGVPHPFFILALHVQLLHAPSIDFCPLPITTSTPLFTLTPLHSAPTASSIHLHVVVSTFSRTKSSSAFAPGALAKMASAPIRGIWRAEERRGSVDVARGTMRVGCVSI
jgi:hypothetical protein